MSEFSYKILSDVTIPPISGKRPSGGVNTETEGVPSLGGENILSGGGVIYEVIKKIPFLFYQSMPKGKLNKFDVLINKDGAQTGKVGLYKGEFDEAAINEHLFIMRPIENTIIDPTYLYYSILLPETQRKIERRITGSAQPGLNSGFVKSVDIPYHGIKKQKKIKNVLETIDQTIEKTESLIHKYQQIKAGLMRDLFTRGLTADGKLRPPREQAPELYQETPVGWIPKEWGCEQVADLLAPGANNMRSGPFGSALLKAELVEEGIPFLGIDNIHVENFVPIFHRFVSIKKFRELSKYAVKPRDVVITIMGTVGRCAIVPDYIDQALSSKHLWTMTFDQEKVVPELICWQLNYADWVKSWFRRETQGGIMDAIQSKTLKTLRLPIPPPQEQGRISARYSAISATIKTERDNLGKVQKQKSGLMHDLLTGKVPVSIDQAETAHV